MSTEPAAPEPARATPPAARRVPYDRTFHGDTFVDEYAWLAEKNDPETIAYLEAENAFTEAMTAGQAGLRNAIFGEIKASSKETALWVPTRKGQWCYYTRTVEGMQYPVYCRRAVRPDDAGPPISQDGSPLDGEEVLLDGNELAGDEKFFSLGAYDVSPDGRLLAYSTDFSGSERFTMRIKNLVTGETAADQIPDTFYGSAWSRDGSALFYVTVDEAWRPYRVWRHMVGAPAAGDVIVYEEENEKFWVGVGLTRSERYLLITAESKLTSEAQLLDATRPEGEFSVVMPRRPGVEYSVEHQVRADGTDRLLILHNDHAENFELAQAPVQDPAAWTPLISHREDTRLLGVAAFAEYLVVHLRRDGLTGLRIVRPDGAEHEVAFGEPVYTVAPGANPEYESRLFRLGYVSLVTPDSVYDCDMTTGQLTLLKRRPVLPLPGGSDYDPGDYEQYREWATAADGKMLHKINTFTDFVACAEHLVAQGWTTPSRLIARGGSAGGLLMGAVANLAPQDFGGIVAHVPFVDALTTILDPSLPLTVTEWEEWGDPLHDPQVYDYMKSYSPYENVTGQAYPPILAVTSLNDTRVLYREPAKWIARLQEAGRGGPFLLKTEMAAGHGGRSGRYDAWHEEALALAWIVTTPGAAAAPALSPP